MVKSNGNNFIHTPNTKFGHGDNQGTAIRNKMARPTDIGGGVKNKIKVKSPPKSLA